MKTKEKLYTKVTCPACTGTGEIDSWNGVCWNCDGKGYIYLEVPQNAYKWVIDKRVRE